MIFLYSDPHHQHKNICRGVSSWSDKSACRDFDTVEEMDAAILASVNDIVGENDVLWCLGDFCFGDRKKIPELRAAIKCKTVHLVYGNHDDKIRETPAYQACFASCQEYKEIRLADKTGQKHKTILFHYYIGGVWHEAQKGSFHALGHSHGTLPKGYIRGRAADVGWDVFRRPISEHEFCDMMLAIPVPAPADHHSPHTNFH